MFNVAFWQYVLGPVDSRWRNWRGGGEDFLGSPGWFFRRCTWDCQGWLVAVICRWRGHPCGPIWFNPGALEPDMHCKNCGDDLG